MPRTGTEIQSIKCSSESYRPPGLQVKKQSEVARNSASVGLTGQADIYNINN